MSVVSKPCFSNNPASLMIHGTACEPAMALQPKTSLSAARPTFGISKTKRSVRIPCVANLVFGNNCLLIGLLNHSLVPAVPTVQAVQTPTSVLPRDAGEDEGEGRTV